MITEDQKIIELKQRLEENLTYYSYDMDVDVIKKVSQIILKAVCELKKLEGATVPRESLASAGEQLS